MIRSRRTLGALVALAIASATTVALGTPASAGNAQFFGNPVVNVNDTATAVAVSGTLCLDAGLPPPPNAFVILSAGANTNSLPGVANVQITPDGTGSWNGILNVPAGLTPGPYTLWAQCVGNFNYQNIAFTVTAPAVPTAPSAPVLEATAALTG